MFLTWQTHLDLITSHYGIEGVAKKAVMQTFLCCDPNASTGGCPPAITKDSDPDYEKYRKAIGKAYKLLGFPDADPGKGENVVLPWLRQQYQTPDYSWKQPETRAKELDAFLRELNYLEQRQQFQKAIQGADVAKVILVPANGTFTQRWLVKRLSLEVSNHGSNKGFSVSAKSKWDRDRQHFWKALSQYTDPVETPEEIIQVLCDRCRTQPLIMAVHGIQDIEPSTLQALLSDFWEKLIQKLNEQSLCGDRYDCILFLTTKLGTQHSISDDYGVNLPPWDFVTVGHMQQWLKPAEVQQFLAECSGQSAKDACLDLLPKGKQPPDNLGPPEDILSDICRMSELDSPAELETYWKIAS